MTPLRSAIVGTGGIAGAHARAVDALDGIELVAAVDIDPDRLATFTATWPAARGYPGLAELLAAERLDLVHVCTPPGTHAGTAIAALEAGVNVVCEKPPCLSLAELDRIQAAERAGGAWFAVIFQHRFGSAAQYVKQAIDDKTLGAPLVATCETWWYRGDAYFEPPWRGAWDSEGGGPSMGHGIHQVDLLGHLLGDWVELGATASRLERDVETEDVAVAWVRFANGALATIVNSILSPREESYLRFDFTDGTLEVRHLYGYRNTDWTYTPRKDLPPGQELQWPPPGDDVPSSHAAQLAVLVDRLRAGQSPPADIDSVRRTMQLTTAIYASTMTGAPVRRADLTPAHPFYAAMNGGRPDYFAPPGDAATVGDS